MCKRGLVRARIRHVSLHENSSSSAQRSGPALQMSWAATSLVRTETVFAKSVCLKLNIEHSLNVLVSFAAANQENLPYCDKRAPGLQHAWVWLESGGVGTPLDTSKEEGPKCPKLKIMTHQEEPSPNRFSPVF
jgi:hypothetical protein